MLAALTLADVCAQTANRLIHLDATNESPMSIIAQQVERTTRVPICYEEAPTEYSEDLADMTKKMGDPAYLKEHTCHKFFVPAKSRLKQIQT